MAKLKTKAEIQDEINLVQSQLDDVYNRLEKGEINSHDAKARNSILGKKIKQLNKNRIELLKVEGKPKDPSIKKEASKTLLF